MSIGQITNAIGLKKEACESFQKAVEVYQSLCESFADNRSYQSALGWNAQWFGCHASAISGWQRKARESSERALAIFEKLTTTIPTKSTTQPACANAEFSRFLALYNKGQWVEAETSIRRVLSLCEMLSRKQPEDDTFRGDLASAHYHFGNLKRATNRTSEALNRFDPPDRCTRNCWSILATGQVTGDRRRTHI